MFALTGTRSRRHASPVSALPIMALLLISGNTVADEVTEKRVTCIFSSSSVMRPDEFSMRIEDIPFEYCTHLLYDHISLDLSTPMIMPSNPAYDVLQDGWQEFSDLKKTHPEKKRLLMVHSPLFINPLPTIEQRGIFVNTVTSFLTDYQLDGVAMLWFGSVGTERNEVLYKLAEELRGAFAAAGHPTWETSVMLIINEMGIDPARLCKMVDFVSLMGAPEGESNQLVTNVLAPLSNRSSDTDDLEDLSITTSLQVWLDSGCPASKIQLGVPFVGRTYTLADPEQTGLNSPVSGPGPECSFMKIAGPCAYFELCQKFNESQWTFGWDVEGVSPYAYQGDLWVGYDNAASIAQKANFARLQGLAGVFGWSLDHDDYRGKCGAPYPLSKALWEGFQAKSPAVVVV